MKRAVAPTPTFRLSLTWDEASKRWRLDFDSEVGRARARHWMWVDTTVPVDATAARALARAVVREMDSWLPFY